MNYAEIVSQIYQKQSFLCIGLDVDIHKIPKHLLKYEDPIFEFNKQIIDATQDLCVAYKPNTAFYECYGVKGWQSLQKTCAYIPKSIFSIADAKRGDIGNTSAMYAQAFFDVNTSGLNFDSITIAPYMGSDSVKPFLSFENKWVILLALTSNVGGTDFQLSQDEQGIALYQKVILESRRWCNHENMMYVVGATRPEFFEKIRKIAPKHFLLVPGVGAQGGSLQEVCKYGLNESVGLLINSSRGIIYASGGEDFAEKAREKAMEMQQEMRQIMMQKGLVF